jgi:hypothetical protein
LGLKAQKYEFGNPSDAAIRSGRCPPTARAKNRFLCFPIPEEKSDRGKSLGRSVFKAKVDY